MKDHETRKFEFGRRDKSLARKTGGRQRQTETDRERQTETERERIIIPG